MITSIDDLLFLLALLLPLVPISAIIYRVSKYDRSIQRHYSWLIFLFFTLLLNPFSQILFLSPLDDKLNAAYLRKANAAQLVGKPASSVQSIFGNPDVVVTYPPSVYNGESIPGHVLWEYKALPGFWLGYSFQVSFAKGAVISFEGFDN